MLRAWQKQRNAKHTSHVSPPALPANSVYTGDAGSAIAGDHDSKGPKYLTATQEQGDKEEKRGGERERERERDGREDKVRCRGSQAFLDAGFG